MVASDPLGELVAKLAEIAPLASQVAELKERTVQEEAAAFEKILEHVKPLLSVVAYKTPNGYYSSGQQFHKEKWSYFEDRGLVLIDAFEQEYTDRDTRGDYAGWRLVLFEDGRLMAFERRGAFSRWQGESSSWEAYEEEILSPHGAVKRWGLKRLVAGLAEELKDAAQGLEQKQEDYLERLEPVQKVREVLQ